MKERLTRLENIINFLKKEKVIKMSLSKPINTYMSSYLSVVDFDDFKKVFDSSDYMDIEWKHLRDYWDEAAKDDSQLNLIVGYLDKLLKSNEISENSHTRGALYFKEEEFPFYIGYLSYDNNVSKKKIFKRDTLSNFLSDIEENEREENSYRNLEKYDSLQEFKESYDGDNLIDYLFGASVHSEVFINQGVIYVHPH